MSDFRPLLAATIEDPSKLRLPLLISPKLDGIRCIMLGGKPHSRNLKILRNRYVQRALKDLPDGLDGELIVGDASSKLAFNSTTSGIMSEDGEPDFRFHVFDNAFISAPFINRWDTLIKYASHPRISIVPHGSVHTLRDLLTLEQYYIENGFEGVMFRRPDGRYKHGRSTLNEAILMKLKRFRDGEAFITGCEEGVHNLNEATTDALGLTVRSSHKGNLIGSGRIGTILGIDRATGKNVTMSPGRMTQDQRIYFWNNQKELFCKVAKYKAFDYGQVNVPRFCTFQGFRDPSDT